MRQLSNYTNNCRKITHKGHGMTKCESFQIKIKDEKM